MVRQLNQKLASDYPELLELNHLLNLSEKTWQRYGLSADKLAEQNPYVIELITILVQ